MKCTRFFWLTGACALSLLLVMSPLGCQPEPPSTPPSSSPTTPADDESADPGGQPGAQTDTEPAAKLPAKEDIITPKSPLGLPPLSVPDDNPMTAAKIELGKLLFFDKRLSGDNSLACTECHNPKTGWTEHEATAAGIKDKDGKEQVGGRNVPTIINAAYYKEHFWDGRAPGLEAQATGPIQNPIEMGQDLDDLVAELSEVDGYKEKFLAAFGTGVTKDGIAKALASFERTILGGNSPYDRFKAGSKKALFGIQKRGMELFMDAGCSMCHAPPLFSNHQYQNTGVGMDKEKPDEGRKAFTKSDGDLGKFRVPELRNVEKTWPYFHDGSAKTLQDAVALMADGGKDNDHLSPMLKAVREAKLTDEDKAALVEFLKTLTGEYPIVDPPELP